ncbi:MAG: 50S ribosomal protein L20 [Planctomycetes bacterium]|nr:50S ribosomal protein L20 [Planctomycetota bacterium]MCB9871102.1 50S ribosomal protein L20 [Planctomycetota bacterium]MCB9888260.1 50S ribosomal protein L20 [Planctomycetota bacterium]
MRATYSQPGRQRKNRILKRAKGFRGGRSRLIRTATEATERADAFAFAGRRQRKRHFRQLWIARLSAAVQAHGMLYSRFIHGVQKAGIKLNRKELSELAIHDPNTFGKLVGQAKAAIA